MTPRTFALSPLPAGAISADRLNPHMLACALSGKLEETVVGQVAHISGADKGKVLLFRPDWALVAAVSEELSGTPSRVYMLHELAGNVGHHVAMRVLSEALGVQLICHPSNRTFDPEGLEPQLTGFEGDTNLIYVNMDGQPGDTAHFNEWFGLARKMLVPRGALVVQLPDNVPACNLVTAVPPGMIEFQDDRARVGMYRVNMELDADEVFTAAGEWGLRMSSCVKTTTPVGLPVEQTRQVLAKLGMADVNPLASPITPAPTVYTMVFRKE